MSVVRHAFLLMALGFATPLSMAVEAARSGLPFLRWKAGAFFAPLKAPAVQPAVATNSGFLTLLIEAERLIDIQA